MYNTDQHTLICETPYIYIYMYALSTNVLVLGRGVRRTIQESLRIRIALQHCTSLHRHASHLYLRPTLLVLILVVTFATTDTLAPKAHQDA